MTPMREHQHALVAERRDHRAGNVVTVRDPLVLDIVGDHAVEA